MTSHISHVALSCPSELGINLPIVVSETTRVGFETEAGAEKSAEAGGLGWKADGLYIGSRTER